MRINGIKIPFREKNISFLKRKFPPFFLIIIGTSDIHFAGAQNIIIALPRYARIL